MFCQQNIQWLNTDFIFVFINSCNNNGNYHNFEMNVINYFLYYIKQVVLYMKKKCTVKNAKQIK